MKKKDEEELAGMVAQFVKEGQGNARPAVLIGIKDLVYHHEGFSGEMVVVCSGGLDPLALVDILQEATRLAKESAGHFPDPERNVN